MKKLSQSDVGFWLGILIIIIGIAILYFGKPLIINWWPENTGITILIIFTYILASMYAGFTLPTFFSNLKKTKRKKKK